MTLSMVESGATSAESFRKFKFSQDSVECDDEEVSDSVEILIPELLQASYSSYTWPSAPILSLFLWQRRSWLVKKRILELGSGTSLPGILAAKCGAQVTLTDRTTLPKTLAHIHRCCQLNNLTPGKDIGVKGLTWGLLLNSVFNLGPIDLIIGSDIFYDPSVFEDIIVTVAFLLEHNPGAKFLVTYQERSADWSIEALLKKWKLKCANVSLSGIIAGFDSNLKKFMGGHTVHLLEITLASLHRVFVGNLSWTASGKDLKMYFSKFGHVASSSVIFDKNTGLSKGYGFVEFSTQDGLMAATNNQVHFLEGRVLTVQKARNVV